MRKLEVTLNDMPCTACKGRGNTGILLFKKPCRACEGTGKIDRTFSIRDIPIGKIPYFTELQEKIGVLNSEREALPVACEAIAEVFGNQFTPQEAERHLGIMQINAFYRAFNDVKNG